MAEFGQRFGADNFAVGQKAGRQVGRFGRIENFQSIAGIVFKQVYQGEAGSGFAALQRSHAAVFKLAAQQLLCPGKQVYGNQAVSQLLDNFVIVPALRCQPFEIVLQGQGFEQRHIVGAVIDIDVFKSFNHSPHGLFAPFLVFQWQALVEFAHGAIIVIIFYVQFG